MTSLSKPISPLRQRMIEDMTLRKLAPKTQSGYLRWVKRLAEFVGRSPDTATAEDLRRYIGCQLFGGKPTTHPKTHGHRRIKVATRDVADGECHRQHRQAKRQRHAEQADTQLRERGSKHRTSASTQYQPEGSYTFR